MPKMRFGIFEDKAVERWYTLWRAEYIVSFYKETASLNIVMCALQFFSGMVQNFAMECLNLIVSSQASEGYGKWNFFGITLLKPSRAQVLWILARPLLQLSILAALILPMKFLNGLAGRNVWRFQLLALGQAVTHLTFVFVDTWANCSISYAMPHPDGSVFTRGGIHFIFGGHLIFPLLMIALSVQLRRIPEVAIMLATFGSFVLAMAALFICCWEMKVLLFFFLTRLIYAAFAIMIARSFETARREVFSSQVLPFLVYISTLANSHNVDSIGALRSKHNRSACQKTGLA